jgi:hypothetical protein
VYINMPANMLSISMLVGLGLVAYARYFHCDPFVLKRIDAFDQVTTRQVKVRGWSLAEQSERCRKSAEGSRLES